MKLTKVRITNFQSIQDSTEFDIGDITCLVGKNESGKTALLKALYRLNPITEADGNFNTTSDYPRQHLGAYSEKQERDQVVQATYRLEPDDIAAVEEFFGCKCLKDNTPTVILKKGYTNPTTASNLSVDTDVVLKHIAEDMGLAISHPEMTTSEEISKALASSEDMEVPWQYERILQSISACDISSLIFHQILQSRIPKFLYFDEYYQMKGEENLDALYSRRNKKNPEDSDHPLLAILDAASPNLNQILNLAQTELQIATLESVTPDLTDVTEKILASWSQSQHHRIKFEIRPALPEDSLGMTAGTNIWIRVEDTRYNNISTSFGTQSRGFVWFFSFLAWYQKLRKDNENLLLLLDEPGLSLHAKAQGDLLRYFEEELVPYHQLIYTTHSPFMVDPRHFDRVRIVQDLSIEPDSDNLSDEERGTKVIAEGLKVTQESLFPLQGALGYEIYQTLFIGPNNLIVEGVSDLRYIENMSALLKKRGKTGLSLDWTITPVGGFDKVSTFVALIGANTKLNIAVLIDYQKKDQQKIENLYKKKLLKKNHIFTYAGFVENNEADIEDMFAPEFYLKLVNGEFGTSLDVADVSAGHPRILRCLEDYFKNNPIPNGAKFDHYRPAAYFCKNVNLLENDLTNAEFDRFQKVFDDLNKLLVT